MKEPVWFEKVRAEAQRVWDYCDKEASTRNLRNARFNGLRGDVKHVISELLQNANDVGAKEALITFENGTFIFEHNGEDFNDEKLYNEGKNFKDGEFCHLCSFSCSTKSSLKTIGNHGVGFKTTFALGRTVQLNTPTISIKFNDDMFHVPIWESSDLRENLDNTRVTIVLDWKPEVTAKELTKSIDDWRNNLDSLHLFEKINKLTINGKIYETEKIDGTVDSSENIKTIQYIKFTDKKDPSILKIVGYAGVPPDKICEDICKCRNNETEESVKDTKFEISIMTNLSGVNAKPRLYSILPVTKSHSSLSFSLSAPFFMDVERTDIIPVNGTVAGCETNKWLLQRTGVLTLSAMSELIKQFASGKNNQYLSLNAIYSLLPNYDLNTDDLAVETINSEIKKNFDKYELLIDIDGKVVKEGLIINPKLFDIFEAETIKEFYKDSSLPILSQKISACDNCVKKLRDWGIVTEENDCELYRRFLDSQYTLCIPDNDKLCLFWDLIYELWKKSDNPKSDFERLCLFPSKNGSILHPISDVLITQRKIMALPDELLDYIESKTILFKNNFRRYLEEKSNHYNGVLSNLGKLNKDESSIVFDDSKTIIKKLVNRIKTDEEYLTIVRIAFLIDCEISEDIHIKYLTENGSFSEKVYVDKDNLLDMFLPLNEVNKIKLSSEYLSSVILETERDGWNQWIDSGKSGLLKPLQMRYDSESKEYRLDLSIFENNDNYLSTNKYNESEKWAILFCYIINKNSLNQKQMIYRYDDINPEKKKLQPWILFFKNKNCLLGSDGKPHLPDELFSQNETEEYMYESVIYAKDSLYQKRISDEYLRLLYKELGVHLTPGYPRKFIEKIETAVSIPDSISADEICALFKNIDKIYCSDVTPKSIKTDIINKLKEIGVVYTNKETWYSIAKVCITDSDGIGILTLHPDIHDLNIFKGLDVRKHPTTDDRFAYIRDAINRLNNVNSIPLNHNEIVKMFGLISKYFVGISKEESENRIESVQKLLNSLSFGYTQEKTWADKIRVFTEDCFNIPDTYQIHPDIKSCNIWDFVGIYKYPTEEIIREYAKKIISKINERLPQTNFRSDEAIKSFKDLNLFYVRLMADTDEETAKSIFSNLLYVYSNDCEWVDKSSVFTKETFRIPKCHLVHEEIKNLDCWKAIGIISEPDDEHKLHYLREAIAKINSKPSINDLSIETAINIFISFNEIYNKSERTFGIKIEELLRDVLYVLSTDNLWVDKKNTYIKNTYDIPNTYRINTKINNLDIWKIVGVKDNPSPDYIFTYLKQTSFEEINRYSSSSEIVPDDTVVEIYERIKRYYNYAKDKILKELESSKVYTEGKKWLPLHCIYRNRNDIPDSDIIFRKIANFKFWDDLKIHDEPDDEDYLTYLGRIPTKSKINEGILPKIEFLFNRYPEKVLEIGYLVSLNNKWMPINDVEYYLENEASVPRIFSQFKDKIAKYSFIKIKDEFNRAVDAYCNGKKLKVLANLIDNIEWCVAATEVISEIPPEYLWVNYLKEYLTSGKIPSCFPDGDEYLKLGKKLSLSKIIYVKNFYDVPHLNNEQISTGNPGIVRWEENKIYISQEIKPFICNTELQQELSKYSNETVSNEVKRLLGTCCDRDKEKVFEYCDAFFTKHYTVNNSSGISDPSTDANEEEVSENTSEESNENSIAELTDTKETEDASDYVSPDTNKSEYGCIPGSVSPNPEKSEEGISSVSGVSASRKTNGGSGSGKSKSDYGDSPSENFKGHKRKDDRQSAEEALNKITNPQRSNATAKSDDWHGSKKSDKSAFQYAKSVDDEVKDREKEAKATGPDMRISRQRSREPTTQEREFLDSLYHGECQLCHEKYPKKGGDESGNRQFIYYATNILPKLDWKLAASEDLGWNTLCLCPTCALRFADNAVLPPEFKPENIPTKELSDDELRELFNRFKQDEDGHICIPITLLGNSGTEHKYLSFRKEHIYSFYRVIQRKMRKERGME